MSEIFSISGQNIHKAARVSVISALYEVAAMKNVPLNPALCDELAGRVLDRMDFPSIHQVSSHEEDGLIAMVKEIDTHLDATATVRLRHLISTIEGKESLDDPAVETAAQAIVAKFAATLPKQGCPRWPDLVDMVSDYYATVPRGPTVAMGEDGTVCTRWWLGRDFHRDPKEGPANIEENGARRIEEYWVEGKLHRPHQDGPAIVYTDAENGGKGACRVEEYRAAGNLHRPHEDGPAMIYTHFQNFDLSGEEYFENGKRHRPSELGPAVTHWDRNGEPVMKLFYENGEHHRDPSAGPAWWHIRDARTDRDADRPFTEFRYYVRGQLHRDEKDGPAWIKRDDETSALVMEEYWRDGVRHRGDGPAIVERWPNGAVSYEAYWRRGRIRDWSEGPSTIRHDAQGRLLSEEWFTANGSRHREAADGPGSIGHDPETGRTHEAYYIDDQYRLAPHGPAVVTRDREGNILWQQFWDGERMHVKYPEPVRAEASAHG